ISTWGNTTPIFMRPSARSVPRAGRLESSKADRGGSRARVPAHGPERAGLERQRGHDGGGEGRGEAAPLDQQRQYEEEAGEGEEAEQQTAQHAHRGPRPLEVMRESGEDRAIERIRRQQAGQ